MNANVNTFDEDEIAELSISEAYDVSGGVIVAGAAVISAMIIGVAALKRMIC